MIVGYKDKWIEKKDRFINSQKNGRIEKQMEEVQKDK